MFNKLIRLFGAYCTRVTFIQKQYSALRVKYDNAFWVPIAVLYCYTYTIVRYDAETMLYSSSRTLRAWQGSRQHQWHEHDRLPATAGAWIDL